MVFIKYTSITQNDVQKFFVCQFISFSCSIHLDQSCGGTLTESTGYFQSPNFPNPYAHNIDCVWLISRPSETIEITFLEFDTEISHDYLAITLDRQQIKDKTYEWSGQGTPLSPFQESRLHVASIQD